MKWDNDTYFTFKQLLNRVKLQWKELSWITSPHWQTFFSLVLTNTDFRHQLEDPNGCCAVNTVFTRQRARQSESSQSADDTFQRCFNTVLCITRLPARTDGSKYFSTMPGNREGLGGKSSMFWIVVDTRLGFYISKPEVNYVMKKITLFPSVPRLITASFDLDQHS